MRRFLIFLLVLILCLTGCGKKQSDIPGGEAVPEGIDWKLWEQYTPATLTLGEETVDVLIALDAIHLAIYYDADEQELMDSFTIPTPLSDLDYSRDRLRILDENADGYDDICVPDMLPDGDRIMSWWLWDPAEETYVYAPEQEQYQEDIGADIAWMAGKHFINASMDTPNGPQDMLILLEEQQALVYLDSREEKLWGTAELPEPLSQEARSHLQIYTYLDCVDISGDGWGDLQLPCRWEEAEDGSVYQYNHCWVWEPESKIFRYDSGASAQPVI